MAVTRRDEHRFILLVTLSLWWQSLAASVPAVNSTFLDIRWQGSFTAHEKEKLTTWLRDATAAASGIYGGFPRDSIRLVVQKAPGQSEPVPFAQVIRQQPEGVRFWIDPAFPLHDFLSDWTAIHELVHLYIPFPGQDDVWLSEGLATYYQNILQARAGKLTETETWQRLYEGFQRGMANNEYSHLSLARLSPKMHSTRSYMRLYWSGTAYFLAMDLALRQREPDPKSLDEVIAGYTRCCLAAKRRTNGAKIAGRL